MTHLLITKVSARSGKYGQEYPISLRVPEGSVSHWDKEERKLVREPVDSMPMVVSYHHGIGKWICRPETNRSLRTELGCVGNKFNDRASRINLLKEEVRKVEEALEKGRIPREEFLKYLEFRKELIGLFKNYQTWSPCSACRFAGDCEKKRTIYRYFTKVSVSPAHSAADNWIVCMSAAAVIAKLVSLRTGKQFPLPTPSDKWVGIQKCRDCLHAKFVVRADDPEDFDPLTGMPNQIGRTSSEVERTESISDMRCKRDTMEKAPFLRCLYDGMEKRDEDACSLYLWKGVTNRTADFVPASNLVIVEGRDIISGSVRANGVL